MPGISRWNKRFFLCYFIFFLLYCVTGLTDLIFSYTTGPTAVYYVEMILECTSLSLPLQPIVENSVKHGRDPDAGPFHIFIRTRKTDAGSEIIVEDDGPGFDQAAGMEPNNALENIRQKLEIMCGGCLTIGPGEGGGVPS